MVILPILFRTAVSKFLNQNLQKTGSLLHSVGLNCTGVFFRITLMKQCSDTTALLLDDLFLGHFIIILWLTRIFLSALLLCIINGRAIARYLSMLTRHIMLTTKLLIHNSRICNSTQITDWNYKNAKEYELWNAVYSTSSFFRTSQMFKTFFF